jgi:hypothetical protein
MSSMAGFQAEGGRGTVDGRPSACIEDVTGRMECVRARAGAQTGAARHLSIFDGGISVIIRGYHGCVGWRDEDFERGCQ